MTLKPPLKPRMETVLWYLGLSPFMPKHFPSWMSRGDRNVAVSTKDHDSSLSCFDFCTPPPASQMFQTRGVLADLCCSLKNEGLSQAHLKMNLPRTAGRFCHLQCPEKHFYSYNVTERYDGDDQRWTLCRFVTIQYKSKNLSSSSNNKLLNGYCMM